MRWARGALGRLGAAVVTRFSFRTGTKATDGDVTIADGVRTLRNGDGIFVTC